MQYKIEVQQVAKSGRDQFDIENIPMGIFFTDHMFVCEYQHEEWINPRIEPLVPVSLHPSAMALHYGQAIFEGLKATLNHKGKPVLFRAADNASRLNESAARMAMPAFPEDLFMQGLKMLVDIESAWIPKSKGSSLYLRPFMFADESFTGMRASKSYKFMIFCTPAGPFFSRRIKLFAETKYIRAAQGGTGEAKAAGNYAAAIRPTEIAKANGYDQVLWLDAQNFENIMEVGTMNIFFKIKGEFITPSLDGCVLAGITRSSVIDLLRHQGFKVTERPVSIHEIISAMENSTLEEAFGTGTAVGIARIEEIAYLDRIIRFPASTAAADLVNQLLDDIKAQLIEDPFNWVTPVQMKQFASA